MNARHRNKLSARARKEFLRMAYHNCKLFHIPPHKRYLTAQECLQYLKDNGVQDMDLNALSPLYAVRHHGTGLAMVVPVD